MGRKKSIVGGMAMNSVLKFTPFELLFLLLFLRNIYCDSTVHKSFGSARHETERCGKLFTTVDTKLCCFSKQDCEL
jgi:hypothetical protein